MATDDLLPAACAFAVSVLAEFEQDPDGVPEEAVEAAQQHLATCIRCLSSTAGSTTPRKKKRYGVSLRLTIPLEPLDRHWLMNPNILCWNQNHLL